MEIIDKTRWNNIKRTHSGKQREWRVGEKYRSERGKCSDLRASVMYGETIKIWRERKSLPEAGSL